MESGVSIFWDTVFADKYDPDRADTRDAGGPPDQQPGTTPTGRWTNLTTASPKG